VMLFAINVAAVRIGAVALRASSRVSRGTA
jgi:hypothetical protein